MKLVAIGTQQELAEFRAEGADMMVYLVHGLQIDYRESEPIQWRAPEGGMYFYVTENGGVRPCYGARRAHMGRNRKRAQQDIAVCALAL